MHRTSRLALLLAGFAGTTGCASSITGPLPDPEFQVVSLSSDSVTVTLTNPGDAYLAITPCLVRQEVEVGGEWATVGWVAEECALATIDPIAPKASWTATLGWNVVDGPTRLVFMVGQFAGDGPLQDRLRDFPSPVIETAQ